ncbi:Sensors of blue-light using FAD [Loktanella fryxellensis]|uniref:Sensors of blue-light using FAD n=1 Tax=Loktanella fryxellensis TaxID=245187 RepID=A0A1H8C8H6_9RHOB|nr:BLUF domain-containing protein [Loktanella fryxellensis]SEM90397.1 Sensors of blue-light using FAD [Loktanella fryxellensis]
MPHAPATPRPAPTTARARGDTPIADLTQLIYASQPFGFSESNLNAILMDSRRMNARDDITGALVCRHDIYLQLLEGPTDAVMAAYARINRDDRHLDIRQLVSRPIETRMFGAWAMLHDPADTLILTQDDIAGGVLDRLSQAQIVAMFETVARDAAPEHGSLHP